jgi:hypothetical protein
MVTYLQHMLTCYGHLLAIDTHMLWPLTMLLIHIVEITQRKVIDRKECQIVQWTTMMIFARTYDDFRLYL